MIKEYISQGKNVNIAIENGLLAINKNREDVDIKILETGGLFKKAKVALSYEETEIVENKIEEVASLENEINNIDEQKQEIENVQEVDKVILPVDVLQANLEVKNVENLENEVTETGNKIDEISIVELQNEKQENSTIEKQENKIVDCSRLMERANDFINGVLKLAGINGAVSCASLNNELHFSITGENVGKLIGHRGETLNALQYLLGCVKEAGEGKFRIFLDIEGYKEKRAETLVELANKMADKAEEIERNVHLDPMSAYERRIIHTALQERELVETESTGEGDKRHVVIKFKR